MGYSLFLKFLGSRDITYLCLFQESTGIPRQKCVKKKVDGLTREAVKALMESPEPEAYVFYSRNTGIYGKVTQPAIDKMLKKYAKVAHEICKDVPLNLHAHQFRHAKASHWLEDGMNILQISFLLGHEQLQTTMIYMDITTEDEVQALATLEDENDKKVSPKWKKADGSLMDFCGIPRKK